MWVGGVARHVNDNTQGPALLGQHLVIDKRRNRICEIDAIDKNVMLPNLFIWALTVLCLAEIPLCNVGLWHTSLEEQVDSTATAPAQSSKNHDGGLLAIASSSARENIGADLADKLAFVEVVAPARGVGRHGRQRFAR